jgi:hypothetical protein
MEVVDSLVGDFVQMEPYSEGLVMGAPGGYNSRPASNVPESMSHFYERKAEPMRVRSAKRVPRQNTYNKTRRPTL